jgi:hypothetical protein
VALTIPDALLVLNAGLSSLKWSAFSDEDQPRALLRGQIEGIPSRPHFIARTADAVIEEPQWTTDLDHRAAIEFLFAWGSTGASATHRSRRWDTVVHGGLGFRGAGTSRWRTIAALAALTPLAPLHQPPNVAAMGRGRPGASDAADGLLRHGLSLEATGGRPGICPAAKLRTRRRSAVGVPRLAIRVSITSRRSQGSASPTRRYRLTACQLT